MNSLIETKLSLLEQKMLNKEELTEEEQDFYDNYQTIERDAALRNRINGRTPKEESKQR
ncbi:MAG: hypothetical protein PHQ89_02065 [Bacilli bacterium]|nr:hypothetical protein [Bacilli bacterium]